MDLKRIEKLAVVWGVLLIIGGFIVSPSFGLAVSCGAVFASVNFRLLIWSWGALVENYGDAEKTAGLLPRFALKYAFLLIGIFLILGGLKTDPLGFALGVANIFLAMVVLPILPKTERSN